MDTNTIKKIGSREEVYKCLALHTIGGLYKNDILEKKHNDKFIYISKKISDKMKAQISIIRETNPNFFKKQKKTLNISSINNKNHSKTQKILFQMNNNEVKNKYYPELKGIDLQSLKEDLLNEEEEEDEEEKEKDNKNVLNKSKKKLEPFLIEEMPDIDMNNM